MDDREDAKVARDEKYLKELSRYKDLRTFFAKLIAERDHLLLTVKKNLEALYIIKIGKNETKCFELRCHAARLKRKIEMIQAMLNRAEKIDLDLIEKKLDQEYAEWEKQVAVLVEKIKNSKDRLSKLMPKEKNEAFQNLYRKLVKRLHPDINPEQQEYEKALWHRLIEAYESGDLEELENIEILLQDEKSPIEDFDSMTKLEHAVKTLKEKIKAVIADIERNKDDFPLNIKEKIHDEQWVQKKNNEIAEETNKVKRHILELKSVIDRLMIESINAGDLANEGRGPFNG